jgi:hypothetical protein
MKRRYIASALSIALLFAPLSAMAAGSQPLTQADLAPGPPAGVQTAQDVFAGSATTYVVLGVAAVALIAAAAGSGGGGGGHSSTTSTGIP